MEGDGYNSRNMLRVYKSEQEAWTMINKHLKHHGLKTVTLAEPTQLLHNDDVIGFVKTDSEALRDNFTILMKDGERRQTLIQDLILSNNRLRTDLESAKTPEEIAVGDDEIKDLNNRLQTSDSRIKELEHLLERQAEMALETSEKDHSTKEAAQARVRQLEKRCEYQDEEISRLRDKIGKISQDQKKRERRVQDVFSELKRGRGRANSAADSRLMDVIDSYENEITLLNKKLSHLQNGENSNNNNDDDEDVVSTTGNSERYKSLIKSLNRDLRNSEKESNKLKDKIELLELEMQARPQLDSYNKQKQKIRQLERLLQEHSINIYDKDAFNQDKYSTKTEDIEFLPLQPCRRYLMRICDLLQLADLDQLEPRLESLRTAWDGYPKLEELIMMVIDVVDPRLMKEHRTKHKIWCSKHWKSVIAKLELWRQQAMQLPDLKAAILRLLEQISKPTVSLETDCNLSNLIELIENVTADVPVKSHDDSGTTDTTSQQVLLSIVKHFQHLFDVKSVSGIFPRMNEVFTRYNELKNVIRTIAELLDLGDQYKGSDVVDAVGRVCRSYTSSTYKQLKQLLQEDELDSVIDRLDEHRKFVPLFRDIMDQLMELLDVTRIDQVVPAVRAIKLMIS